VRTTLSNESPSGLVLDCSPPTALPTQHTRSISSLSLLSPLHFCQLAIQLFNSSDEIENDPSAREVDAEIAIDLSRTEFSMPYASESVMELLACAVVFVRKQCGLQLEPSGGRLHNGERANSAG
jgi:hypothetical protein